MHASCNLVVAACAKTLCCSRSRNACSRGPALKRCERQARGACSSERIPGALRLGSRSAVLSACTAGMHVSARAGTVYYFACQRWFSRDHADGAIERTLAATLTPPDAGPLNTYTAEVHTSSLRGAGTDASVALQLFGAQGDSGVQCLKVSGGTTTSVGSVM